MPIRNRTLLRLPLQPALRPPTYQTYLLGIAFFLSVMSACVPGAQAQSQEAVSALGEANRLFAQEEYDQAAAKALAAAELDKSSYSIQQRAAELVYLSGKSHASLELFDRVLKLVPEAAPQNWQRGIALASCGKFKEGAAQFETHHRVNPDDVENSAWYFLCIAKSSDIEAARKTVIPSRGDRREPMMSILQMLKGKLEPAKVLQAAVDNTPAGYQREKAKFYADLYVGLYYDALGESDAAIKYLQRSLTHKSSGYMVDTARVYLADRFPQADKANREVGK